MVITRVTKLIIANGDKSKTIVRWVVMERVYPWSGWTIVGYRRGLKDLNKYFKSLSVFKGENIGVMMHITSSIAKDLDDLRNGKMIGDREGLFILMDLNANRMAILPKGTEDEIFDAPGFYRTREEAVKNSIVRVKWFRPGLIADLFGSIFYRIENFNPDTDRWEVREGSDGEKCYATEEEAKKNLIWRR